MNEPMFEIKGRQSTTSLSTGGPDVFLVLYTLLALLAVGMVLCLSWLLYTTSRGFSITIGMYKKTDTQSPGGRSPISAAWALSNDGTQSASAPHTNTLNNEPDSMGWSWGTTIPRVGHVNYIDYSNYRQFP
jgi:hypothetical protein